MSFSTALIGLSIYILFWEKLPEWGNWFNWLVAQLPKPLAYLYQAWHCPFCFGFWADLAIHGLTDMWTINSLSSMPTYLGDYGIAIAWGLDALATATLIMFGQLCLNAIAVPAIKGYQMTQAFKASFNEPEQSNQ